MGLPKRRAEMFTNEDGLFLGGHPHAGIVSGNVARFVLRSNGKDGHARGFVRLHEAHEVTCQRREGRRQQRASNHGTGGFHPSGRAPGAGDDSELGIDGKSFAEHWNYVLAITIDGEVFHLWIGFPRRHIVIAVICERKVAGTHGLAQNGQADALLRVKELLEERRSLSWREFLREKPGGRVGERGAEAVHFLVFCGVVDSNGQVCGLRRSEGQGGLLPQGFMEILGRFVHFDSGDPLRWG